MKHDNRVGRWRRFQGTILTLAMLSMHLWIKQLRRRRILAWRNSTQQLCISFEQSVNRLGHLTGHATDHPLFPDMGMCPFNDADNLTFQLVNVLAQKPKLFDQLLLFQQEATKARHIFDANALC